MKSSRSQEILTEWHVQTKPTQLNVTLLNERFCTGGRILKRQREASINYVTEVGKSIEIGDHGKKGMPKAGSSMEILRQENDVRQEPIRASQNPQHDELHFPHDSPLPAP